jgi:hypothetical protein
MCGSVGRTTGGTAVLKPAAKSFSDQAFANLKQVKISLCFNAKVDIV